MSSLFKADALVTAFETMVAAYPLFAKVCIGASTQAGADVNVYFRYPLF